MHTGVYTKIFIAALLVIYKKTGTTTHMSLNNKFFLDYLENFTMYGGILWRHFLKDGDVMACKDLPQCIFTWSNIVQDH